MKRPTHLLGRGLLLLWTLDVCAAQGYYSYNPYYGYTAHRRRSTAAALTDANRRAYAARRTTTTQRPNSYLSNPYAAYRRGYTAARVNALPDAYRRRASTTTTTERTPDKQRVSKADAENAKFVGASNQEAQDDATRTLFQLNRRRGRPYGNRCSLFGRQNDNKAGSSTTSNTPKEQGRFLWDLNVYNVYSGAPGGGAYSDVQQSPYGCGGGGGGFGGGLGGGLGGLLSDPYDGGYPAAPPLNNFLSLFAPGILQNALAVTARPPPPPLQGDPTGTGDYQSDPAVDPNYGQPNPPVRRPPPPNRVYFDNPGAAPITPAQLIGGVATTVNGLIQQLTGNVQPVYPSYG